ncbi:MAG: RNA methyltransferase PUA domain-containing protein [Pseudomonadota bacterium]
MLEKQQRYRPAIRLFIDTDLTANTVYQCLASQINYLITVLRLQTGSQIAVFNGRHGEWVAEIELLKKKFASCISNPNSGNKVQGLI